jgi:hypothetical protein
MRWVETHGQDARATMPLEQFAQENKTFMDSSTDEHGLNTELAIEKMFMTKTTEWATASHIEKHTSVPRTKPAAAPAK